MRLEPKSKPVNPYDELTKLQKACLVAAVIAAFIDVFAWFVKIIFF